MYLIWHVVHIGNRVGLVIGIFWIQISLWVENFHFVNRSIYGETKTTRILNYMKWRAEKACVFFCSICIHVFLIFSKFDISNFGILRVEGSSSHYLITTIHNIYGKRTYPRFKIFFHLFKVNILVGDKGLANIKKGDNTNGQKFSTFDRDNDQLDGGACAVDTTKVTFVPGSGGGWWYNNCSMPLLTYEKPHLAYTHVTYLVLKEVKMMIRWQS